MARGRSERGSLVAAAGGILLLVSLFLDWYRLAGFTVTAWTAFEVWDLVLAALALAVITTAATELGYWRSPTHGVGPIGLGVAAAVIVASQLLDPPPSVLHAAISRGGWLALVGAVLMAAGPLTAGSRVTVSFERGTGRRMPSDPAGAPPPPGPAAVPGLGGRPVAVPQRDDPAAYGSPRR